MAVRINQWKLHVQVRGSHCSAPFPDPNCYNSAFQNATGVAAMDTGGCPVDGPLDVVPSSGCVPMLVNLDTDPGETQLRTLICDPTVNTPGPTKGQLDPRCHTQAEIQPILTDLWALYNSSNCRGEPSCDLWGRSEIGALRTIILCNHSQATNRIQFERFDDALLQGAAETRRNDFLAATRIVHPDRTKTASCFF